MKGTTWSSSGTDHVVERAARECRFGEASRLALERGHVARAVELALEAGDRDCLAAACKAIASQPDATTLVARARALAARRGDLIAEAVVIEAIGSWSEAADLCRQAASFDREGRLRERVPDVLGAIVAYERHLTEVPEDDDIRIRLAELLLEVGRPEATLRALAKLDEPRTIELRATAESVLNQAASVHSAAAGAVIFGRYEVVREVSSSPHARVLLARDRLMASAPEVILKVFVGLTHRGGGRDALVRFRREVEILGRLEGRTILKPLAFLDEGPTLVLPWMSGGNLGDELRRGRPWPARVAEVARSVLEALEVAHRAGIVHRDVKPENVLVDAVYGLALSDFGVALLDDPGATATAGYVGTPAYMSPEQRLGLPLDARSDLYSVGILLLEAIGIERAELEALPADVRMLLEGLLAEDLDRRIASAREALAQLERITWPSRWSSTLERRPNRSVAGAHAGTASEERFVQTADRRWLDRWLDRHEERIDTDDPRMPLAVELALRPEPLLPSILGTSNTEGDAKVWFRVERIVGAPVDLTDLTRDELLLLRATLERLHVHGVTHGDVGRAIRRTRGHIALDFPESPIPPTRNHGTAAFDARSKDARSHPAMTTDLEIMDHIAYITNLKPT